MDKRDTASVTLARGLVLGGVLMLVAGGVLIYPHVRSRRATRSIVTPDVTASPPSPPVTPSPLPGATATQVVPTTTPSPTPTPTPTPAPPTRIVIPAIGVDAPIVPISWETVEVDGRAQAVWEVPDRYAAGWHESSATLSVPGNVVLNGHNTNNGEVFRDLYRLKAGDGITVYSGGGSYAYAVSEVLILPEAGQPLEVRLENARYILPTYEARLTLVTCHPYGSLRKRLIVIAHPQR